MLQLIAWSIPQLGIPDRAVELAERSLALNPNYPSWYDGSLEYVYFFGKQFNKSLEAGGRIKEPFAADMVLMAAAYAHLGSDAKAKAFALKALAMDPSWSAEQWLSDQGGWARSEEPELFVEGVLKAGLPICASAELVSQRPKMTKLPQCEEKRAKA